ncbi:MAG: DUF3108 domain-containing protein [Endozoicomonadaceae bacterium]|nr:DUF3108 domain-containing protein [Endozoicomonadaceae bacterium]
MKHLVLNHWLTLLTLLMLPTASAASIANTATSREELQAFDASYTVTINNTPMPGTAERKLVKQPDGSWQLTFTSNMLFYNFSEQSRFNLDNNHRIQPISYQQIKGALGNNKQASINFDWQRKQADSRENKEQWKLPIQLGDLDKISYQLQLQEDVRQGRKNLHYQVVNEDDRDDYQFLMENEEILETPLGSIKAVRLKMQRDSHRQTWIWLAKDWNYMLIKLRQLEKNKEYVITLTEASIGGKPLKPLKPPQTTKKP